MSDPVDVPRPAVAHWTFLTNHGHVLLCIARDPEMRVREIAAQVGVTERAVQRIVSDLEQAGFLSRLRVGRRNHYRIRSGQPLRHSLERHHHVTALLALLQAPAAGSGVVPDTRGDGRAAAPPPAPRGEPPRPRRKPALVGST